MIQTLVSLKLIICMVDYPVVILKTCPAAQVQLVAHPIHFLQQCKWSNQDALTSGVPASPCNWRNKYPGNIYVLSALLLMFRGKGLFLFPSGQMPKMLFVGETLCAFLHYCFNTPPEAGLWYLWKMVKGGNEAGGHYVNRQRKWEVEQLEVEIK